MRYEKFQLCKYINIISLAFLVAKSKELYTLKKCAVFPIGKT